MNDLDDMNSQNEKKGKLVIISGPSGVGKSTICAKLVKNLGAKLSISATTRSPGEGEIDGENYWFITKEEFERRIDKHEFLEYAEVFGNYYGTLRKETDDALSDGNIVILEIDVQGAAIVKKQCPEAIMIFILPPSHNDLAKRMESRARGENEKIARIRLNSAGQETAAAWQNYDHMVINDDLEQAIEEITQIIIQNTGDKK